MNERINQYMVAYIWDGKQRLPIKSYHLYTNDTIMVSIDDGETFGMLCKDYKYEAIKECLK